MNMYGIANDISFKSLHVKVDLLQYSTIFISWKKILRKKIFTGKLQLISIWTEHPM